MRSFFRLPSYRVFDYQPIYYDPKKEDREKRLNQIKHEMGIERADYHVTMKGAFRKDKKAKINVARKQRRLSNLRILIILLALAAMAYYFLYKGYLPF